ncbi:MAG: PEP/pyruvate-binding domain-containing protein [Anaerolineaceae bacterium]
MKSYIFQFTDSSAKIETVGGKGLSLTRMWQAGFPVPPGIILTTEAYRSFVAANGLQARILEAVEKTDPTDTAGLDLASQTIAAMFTQGSIPPEVTVEIGRAYEPYREKPVAVRSSATAEDLPEASFAGQQETYLNIRGEEQLMGAVKKCWGSLWTARAIAYRIKNEIDPGGVALAVIVQELVFAEAAGVMFTANPVNGNRKEALINAAWGLGEAVVSGAVTPDTLTVEKATSKILERLTAEKDVMTVRTVAGTEEQPVPADRRKKAVLSNRQAAELASLGNRIEEFYGMPMDIEWTLAEGKFAIVQARPITAIPPDWSLPDPKALYARASLAEHIPGPVTPLFGSLGLRIANIESVKMYARLMGKNYRAILKTGEMYTSLNGYVYSGMNMDASSAWLIVKVSFSNLSYFFRGSVPRWQAGREEFLSVVDAWETRDLFGMKPAELLDGVKALLHAASNYFTVLQTCLPAASSGETIFIKFYNSLVKRKGDPEGDIFLKGFESGALRAEKSLYDLAMWIKQSETSLSAFFKESPTGEILESFAAGRPLADVPLESWQELRKRFQNLLEKSGRTAYEFDFSNPTPIETPGLQVEAVKAFLADDSANPHDRQKKVVEAREAATDGILKRLRWPVKGWFVRLLQWVQETGPMREDGIADMGLGHPLMRRLLGELGRRFVKKGVLIAPDDIYWIDEGELDQVIAALETGSPLPDVSGEIPARKAEWEARLKISPPPLLPQKSRWAKIVQGGGTDKQDGQLVLKGVGTSEGQITAPACVLFGPEDFSRMRKGDVLVAVTTTPAWTPLFTLASAVVTDIGGPLSHCSIVAREFGIPAVMSTRVATRLIRDGQMVTVDGGKGTVILTE